MRGTRPLDFHSCTLGGLTPMARAVAAIVFQCSINDSGDMDQLLARPNNKSIGTAYDRNGMIIGMPTTSTTVLGKRLLRIRSEAGYGGERQAAEFARKLGIRPPSLHDLESDGGLMPSLRANSA